MFKWFLSVVYFIALMVLLTIEVSCQPNTNTVYEVGIVNPQPGKHYLVFAEPKADSTGTAQLISGMDYLSPDVSSLIITLLNQQMVGDTLFGEYAYPDLGQQEYVHYGLVQVDDITTKYSAMIVSMWLPKGLIEQMQAGFLVRIKR